MAKKKDISFSVVRSKYNPAYVKFVLSGKIRNVDVRGETLGVHLGLYDDWRKGSSGKWYKLANDLFPETKLKRKDGKKVTINQRVKVIKTLAALMPTIDYW